MDPPGGLGKVLQDLYPQPHHKRGDEEERVEIQGSVWGVQGLGFRGLGLGLPKPQKPKELEVLSFESCALFASGKPSQSSVNADKLKKLSSSTAGPQKVQTF